MKIKVVKGQTVRITLSATTKTKAASVEYIIRNFPTIGEIGALKPTPEDRTKATIIYQAARQSKGQADMFTFSTRYPGGYYSAPAKVIIELSNPAPQIEAPVSIDFGSQILGNEVIREVLLKNSGNIEFQKSILLPAPLELIEPADGKLLIRPGGNVMLKIKYHPEKVGSFKFNYVFQEKPGIIFIGSGLAPFAATTEKVTLLWNKRNQVRQGEFKLANKASSPISLRIQTPYRTSCLSDNPLKLLPGKSGLVTIAIPKEDSQSFKGTLVISTSLYTHTIPLEASPTPPRLEIELPDPSLDHIDFGAASPGETISRTFMIKNLGGTRSVIGLGILPPFQVAKKRDGSQQGTYFVDLESSTAFTINFIAPVKPFGLFSDTLEISTDRGTFRIQLNALVHDPKSMAEQSPIPPGVKKGITDPQKNPSADTPLAKDNPLPPPSPLPPLPDPEKGENYRSPTGFYTRDYVTREYSDSIPTPSGFQLHKPGRHKLTFAWKLPSPDQTVFEMDMRQMVMNQTTYGIESVWVPFHNVDFKRSKGMMYATVKGLNAASIYEFRVLSVGAEGKYSQPSISFGVRTQLPPDYGWIKWLLWLMGLLVIGLLLRRHWKKHNGSIPMPTYWPRSIHWPFD